VASVSSLFVLRIFQYQGTNLRLTVVAPNYSETNYQFYNTNFRVLLIMQYNKVLILLSPTKNTYTTEFSVLQDLLSLRGRLSSEKLTNTYQTWIVQSSILNSVLLLIAVHYFNMNIQESKLKGLSESRFGSMIFLFRIAGIPLKIKRLKPIYTVYMVIVTICSCSTFIAVSVDEFIHRDDLRRAMTTIRVLLSITNVMWIFSYFR
jgi:hypothetical protein